MSKFVVTVFDNEKAAYKGSQALLNLDVEGSIALYAAAVITKSSDGSVEIKDAADEGPIGMATGMLLGTMVGSLGGALGAAAGASAGASAGAAATAVAAGAAGGALGGWYSDLYNVGMDAQFLTDVGDLMQSGKAAVVAELAEGWTAPLDAKMEDLGGTVFRRYRIDVEDEQIERDIEATNRELDELQEEWEQAAAESRAKLQAKINATKEKLQSLKDRAGNKINALKEEADAKISKLSEQIAKAEGDAKEKFEQRREELKTQYEARTEKLCEAGQLTKEALSA